MISLAILLSQSLAVEYNKIGSQDAKKTNPHSQKEQYPAVFSSYQSLESIYSFMETLAGVKFTTQGKTFENRPFKAFRVGNGSISNIIVGGVHGLEWISPATVMFVANFVASNHSEAVALRQNYTFHFVPVVNPDGYEYTRSGAPNSRTWRKNREPNEGSPCNGTDINRNFPINWGQVGGSTDPCKLEYYGKAALSTREAIYLDKYVRGIEKPLSFVDLHAFGQVR
jgi:murein tripeptide amidase MpaA